VSAPDPNALGARAEAMIAELGAVSAESDRLVRLFPRSRLVFLLRDGRDVVGAVGRPPAR